MTPAEYLAMQNRIELLSRLILDTPADDLERFIAAGEHANTIAPFVDPTAWMNGRDVLVMVMAHARAIASARREIQRAAERAGARPEYSRGVGIAEHVRPPGAEVGAKPTWEDAE